jgi:hypothetical protein
MTNLTPGESNDRVAQVPSVTAMERAAAWREMREAMAVVQDTAPDSAQSPLEQEEEIARWVKEARMNRDASLP